ncbi:MAG: hypothetical protein IKW67_04290 [Alphaproteobacteria bacterium]|nr:hypothetical protein [Alphaproteobacteria bacterium]
MIKILNLVLTDFWFEQIKSGIKTHEYRVAKDYWVTRFQNNNYTHVQFQKAYRKNAEKMIFEIKSINLIQNGEHTDLAVKSPVFDIELGKHIK